MQLPTFFVVISVLFAKVHVAGIIIETPKPDNSELVDAAVNILKSCYADGINTVGIAGIPTGAISKTLSLSAFVIPVTLIDDTSRVVNNDLNGPKIPNKLQVFVVTVTNSSALVKTLTQIKNSTWWNHMASFLLLDWPVSNDGCSNAYEVLWEAWKMNLLNSKFMCLHRTRGRLVYTFNPYKTTAPVPWTVEKTYRGEKDHIWSLFVRAYQEGEEICENLDFDKAIDLSGYEIRCCVLGIAKMWYSDFNKTFTLGILYKISSRILIHALNATPKYSKFLMKDAGYVDNTGKTFGLAAEVANGISDVALVLRSTAVMANVKNTYPHFPSSLIAVTNYRGHKSQLEKICSVLDSSSRIGLCLVCLVTIIFFKRILRRSLMTAILNVLLVICNAGIPNIPEQLAPRIYLGSLFLLALTIQGIYQGKLSSLLTQNEPLPNMNNMQDLSRAGYTVHGHFVYHRLIADSTDGPYYIESKIYNCTSEVLRDPKAACVCEKWGLISDAAYSKLHVSKDLFNLHMTYQIRPDWPLEERVNKILSKVNEAHLIQPIFAKEIRSILNILENNENEDKYSTFKVISVQDLNFAFIFLGIGLACATICFVTEMVISRARERITKVRYHIRR